MSEEQLQQLYQACLNNGSLENFSELIQDFQQNLYSLCYEMNEQKLKIVLSILQDSFCLQNEPLQVELLECLKYYQEKTCYTITRKDPLNFEDICFMQFQLFAYGEIEKILLNRNLDSFSDAIRIQSVAYLNSDLYFFYTQALLHYLRTSFFDLDSSEIVRILNLVTTNPHFQSAILEKKLDSFQKGVVQNYIEDVIPIVEFVTDRYIQNDPVIESILTYRLRNKEILKFFVRTLSLQRLMTIFGDAAHFLDFVSGVPYLTLKEKEGLVSAVFNRAKTEGDYDILVELYVHNEENSNFPEILGMNENEVLSYVECYGITNADVIQYYLSYNPTEQFLSNSMFVMKDLTFARQAMNTGLLTKDMFETKLTSNEPLEQKIEKCYAYNMSGRVIPYEDAISLLQQYFSGNVSLTFDSLQAILRTILHQISTSIDAVLFVESPTFLGSMDFASICFVKINNECLRDFLNPTLSWNQRIRLFQTLFHEFRHVIQPNSNFIEKDTFLSLFMENMLLTYDLDFYDRNYDVSFVERDANRFSNLYTWKFLRQFSLLFDISYLLDYTLSEAKSERSFSVSKNKIDLVQAFQKLMDFHPKVAEKYEQYCQQFQTPSLK